MRCWSVCAALLAPVVACGGSGGVTTTMDAASSDVANATDTSHADDGEAGADGDGATPQYNIDVSSTSVSGLSSGGFMAVQFHVAFSSIMKGAAVFAGGPYMCSQGSLNTALTSCAAGTPTIDVSTLVALTNQNATNGVIDAPSALAAQHVFLFGGADDIVVNPVVMDALDAYYAAFVPGASIQYVDRRPGTSHTLPTLTYGNPCDVVSSPYIGDCNYDGAGTALTQIYGTLAPPATTPTGTLVAIPQGAYISNPAQHSLDTTAQLYVPTSCQNGALCKIHVAFHGCLQAAGLVGDAFYAHGGYNEWADTNNIMVLYPQTIGSASNPDACWDFWGYDSPDFATQNGPQMAMVRAMIAGLAN
jgi:poly(3-hydroxybutyrate) depolymerase